jgi:hypothetical protein
MTAADGEKKRGGQRGERPWRDKPTPRERVLTQNLADFVKSETGRDVSSETVRAIRYCLPKWNTAESTKALRENMDRKLEKAKLQDKREKALAMLKEAESELGKFSGEADLDDEDDETDSDGAEYSDDSDDDDDDIFSESDSDEKVSASF